MDLIFVLKAVMFTICLPALVIVTFVYSCVYEHLENKDKAIAVISILLLLIICICTKS